MHNDRWRIVPGFINGELAEFSLVPKPPHGRWSNGEIAKAMGHVRSNPVLDPILHETLMEMTRKFATMEAEQVEQALREAYVACGSPYGTEDADVIRYYRDHMEEWQRIVDDMRTAFHAMMMRAVKQAADEAMEKAMRAVQGGE